MADILLGTSGWSYNEWAGVFYPNSATNKLSFYSKIYRTAEIDSTFYAYPSKGMVLGWARNTPQDFVFTAKLPRTITHEKKLDLKKGAGGDLLRFLELVKPLLDAGKLGAVLIQLPPSFGFGSDMGRLQAFLEAAPRDVRFAVEFRHPSWLRDETWALLRSNRVANVIVDEPLLPPDTVVTADFAFVRWHGRGSRPWYNYRYSDAELAAWVPKVKDVVSRAEKTYGYFNNHFKGFAVENSLKMMGMLKASTPQQDEARERATRSLDGGRRKSGETSMLEFMGREGTTA